MQISELRPGGHIELKAEIVSIQPIRKLWKCFECNEKGLWREQQEFSDNCPNCGAEQSDKSNTGLWLQEVTSALIKDESGNVYMDLWKNEISKFKEGDKIHLINGYARTNSKGGLNVSSGRYGNIVKYDN